MSKEGGKLNGGARKVSGREELSVKVEGTVNERTLYVTCPEDNINVEGN